MSDTPHSSKSGWLTRLQHGLRKTSQSLSDGITATFTKRKLDEATLESLEELLLAADVGIKTTSAMLASLREEKFDKHIDENEVRMFLSHEITTRLLPFAKPLELLKSSPHPHVILVVGVNGNGKTTTIGKLAHRYARQGKKVMLAAADTFRAAAGQQLKIWADRAQVPLIIGAENSDPASVAYQAMQAAYAQNMDVLMIDTAGRLHNKEHLMAELEKMLRVIRKIDETAPHTVLQVIDATTGQNALAQVAAFHKTAGVTGLIVTKLDGSAKAGVVLALTSEFHLPIHAIGVGEAMDDLQAFSAESFAQGLLGVVD